MRDDAENVNAESSTEAAPPGDALLAIYDDAVVDVFGYFHRRCRNRSVAEDLTTETFLAAVESIERGVVTTVSVAWLVGIARHKLVDHWRRLEREQRRLVAVDDLPVAQVAQLLDRTVHATEALLVRARRASRARYEEVTS